MVFFRFILLVFLIVLFTYYFMLAFQLWGVLTFTKTKISFKKALIPFYYWFN